MCFVYIRINPRFTKELDRSDIVDYISLRILEKNLGIETLFFAVSILDRFLESAKRLPSNVDEVKLGQRVARISQAGRGYRFNLFRMMPHTRMTKLALGVMMQELRHSPLDLFNNLTPDHMTPRVHLLGHYLLSVSLMDKSIADEKSHLLAEAAFHLASWIHGSNLASSQPQCCAALLIDFS